MTTVIRIDNCIVERFSLSGIQIGPIRLYEKQNKVKLVLDDVPYVTTGCRKRDSLLMQGLLSGSVNFDSLDIIYPTQYVLK